VTAAGIIYGGRNVTVGAWELALSEKTMMEKHLRRLENLGRVRRENGRYHLV